jgi:hypothetical protein
MASNSLFIIPGFFLHFPNESLGLKEMGKFLWEGRENGKKNLVFHFGVGRHASFPQKPVVNPFLFCR